MKDFVPFHFAAEVLGEFALPEIDYPVPADFVPRLAESDGEMPFDMMLYWLQMQSGRSGVDWLDLETAMQRLVQLQTLEAGAEPVSMATEGWCLDLAPVPLDQEIVTVERDGYLLAAIRPGRDFGLVAASYRPLDAQSLRLLTTLAARPHPRHGVVMRPNNWEYVLDSAVASDNFYASERDEPYLSHFSFGIDSDEARAVPPAQTATQLRVFCQFEGF